MKRALSILLLFTLIFSSTCNFSMAATNFPAEIMIVQSDNTVKLIDPDNPNNYVIGRDLENGNVEFSQYQNRKLISKSETINEKKLIKTTTYQNKTMNLNKSNLPTYDTPFIEYKEIPNVKVTKSNTPILLSSTRNYLGTILYRYTDGWDSGTCGAKVEYIINTGSKKYDLNGSYRDLAGLAALIAGTLSLPAAPALAIGKNVLTYLGFGLSVTSFIIPHYDVDSDYEQIEYFLTDKNFSGHTNSFYGTKYKITQAGRGSGDIYYEGNYFAYSPWKNTTFGMTVYTHMFAYSNYSISSWN